MSDEVVAAAIHRALVWRAGLALFLSLPALALGILRSAWWCELSAVVWILLCGLFALDSTNGWYLRGLLLLVSLLTTVVIVS